MEISPVSWKIVKIVIVEYSPYDFDVILSTYERTLPVLQVSITSKEEPIQMSAVLLHTTSTLHICIAYKLSMSY